MRPGVWIVLGIRSGGEGRAGCARVGQQTRHRGSESVLAALGHVVLIQRQALSGAPAIRTARRLRVKPILEVRRFAERRQRL